MDVKYIGINKVTRESGKKNFLADDAVMSGSTKEEEKSLKNFFGNQTRLSSSTLDASAGSVLPWQRAVN